MINHPAFPVRPVPAWLTQAAPDMPFLRREVLEGCLFYPACDTDGDPVAELAGFIHSFVYVDYAVGRRKITNQLVAPLRRFRGYSPMFIRDLAPSDLAPEGHREFPLHPRDGNPRHWEDHFKEPLAIWSVLERHADRDDSYGPARFSFVFIGGEGVATYNALFRGNRLRPEMLAIIQPGHAFGGNWTNFFYQPGPLGRCALGNSAGTPTYLLTGFMGQGEEKDVHWPRYPRRLHAWNTNRHALAIWSKEAESW